MWFEPQPDMPGCLCSGRLTPQASGWLDIREDVEALERQADAERIQKRQRTREEREAQKRREQPLPRSVAKGFELVEKIGKELLNGSTSLST